MGLPLFFVFLLSTCCDVFCCRPIVAGFVLDLLQQVVVSLTISFLVSFLVGSSNGKVRFCNDPYKIIQVFLTR